MSIAPSFGRIAPLVAALEALARVQREAAARVARDLGCARTSISLLRALDEQPRQLSDIAAILRIDLSVASRHATHLVEAGLAERAVDPTDRRARTITLTPAGRDLLRRSYDHLAELTERAFDEWTDHDLAEVTAALARLTTTIDGATTAPAPPVRGTTTAPPPT